MHLTESFAIGIYLSMLILIAIFSYRKNQSSSDFMLGGRKMNFWLTALAAHASDMSSWIFMGYPVKIYNIGISYIFVAFGLILFMFLNWKYVSKKLRLETEKYQALTFSSYFESRYSDTSGMIRLLSAIVSFIFYSIYISAGFYGLGLLLESLFQIPYHYGVSLGFFIVIPYLYIGGYITLAWTDFFQGMFLLFVILLVPIFATESIGGFSHLFEKLSEKNFFSQLIPEHSFYGLILAMMMMLSWGLGYFGQPHIVTKFMGIKEAEDTKKSKWVGMSWQIVTLAAATLVGMVAIEFFQTVDFEDQLIFVKMVKSLFSPFFSALILCAILGTTITLADSQILVLASCITEDFYKRILRKNASSKELLTVSRLSILFVGLFSYAVAMQKISSIYELVEFAWFGLGSSFGPLILFSLYSKSVNKQGAIAGIVTGCFLSILTPTMNAAYALTLPPMILAFFGSSLAIYTVSKWTTQREAV
ncbi:MAG: sodium/proline symporter [Chlamydiae bacterium]|jgi:SSS family solute:Na+ symporter|nr:sodium/proline symporter [Chlamydiota bacterium]